MKVSISWLSEYTDLPESQAELEDVLTNAGLTVEGVEEQGADFPHVVIARILESNPHPNADRLSVCRVDDGTGQPRQIVCGAKNYKVGDKVPLALPGAVLPGDFKIKTGKLRGVESEGMMCSAKELNLPGDASGLLILPEDAPVGQPIGTLFPKDCTLELEVTPNRPDCLSHMGVAREIAAFTGRTLRDPRPSEPGTLPAEGRFKVHDPTGCPFYTLQKISGLRNGESPAWLKNRLESIGLRPINAIVDVTNFVLMETGQPLHAFDAAKIRGALSIRRATPGEKFLALDAKEYVLETEDLVIADESGPVALAGVMGGLNSGVDESTTEILLESAVFQPSSVRRTARRLGLHSDSSYRFERGVDPASVLPSSLRAESLIVQLAGGSREGDARSSGQVGTDPVIVSFRPERCRAVLGCQLEEEEMFLALRDFGLVPSGHGLWAVPTHRLDLTREIDLVEEVARRVGIQKIPSRVTGIPSGVSPADRIHDFVSKLKRALAARGFSEARTSTLVSAAMTSDSQGVVKLKNPLGEDQAFLRPSLVPALLNAYSRNLRTGEKRILLFETGKVFDNTGETLCLGLVAGGPSSESSWSNPNPPVLDFHRVKGILEAVLPSAVELRGEEISGNEAAALAFVHQERVIGRLFQLSPAACRALDSQVPVFAAQIQLEPLVVEDGVLPSYAPLPEFPATVRDIAVVAPLGLSYATLSAEIRSLNEPLLVSIEPFDVFHDPSGEKLPADSKSLAISLTFRDSRRTLVAEEVNAATDRIKARLKSSLAVGFRE